MFILLISRGIPTKEYPQWGCFEKDQAEALASIGHKVIVISVDGRFILNKRKIGYSEYYANRVEYINLYLFPFFIFSIFGSKIKARLRWYFNSRFYMMLTKKVISKYGKPDIIYSHFYFNTAYATYLKKKTNIPLVGIEHAGCFNNDTLNSEITYLANIAYTNTNAIISVCATLAQRINYHFKRDSYVVYNAVSSNFKYIPTTRKMSHKFTFISVASLLYMKGFDLLVPAFLKADLPKDKWQMIIIGSGEEYDNLIKLIAKNGLEQNIYLLGKKDKNDISTFLNESDAFILPSRMENFSVAILEALACGLPVISSLCGGVRECISDYNGLLFPVNDVDALAEAIHSMYTNYNHYDRNIIAEDCKNRFSSKVVAQNLTDVFDLVLSK